MISMFLNFTLTVNILLNFTLTIILDFRETSLLFLLLMLGTLWLATTLYNFNQTPYLQVRFSTRVNNDADLVLMF